MTKNTICTAKRLTLLRTETGSKEAKSHIVQPAIARSPRESVFRVDAPDRPAQQIDTQGKMLRGQRVQCPIKGQPPIQSGDAIFGLTHPCCVAVLLAEYLAEGNPVPTASFAHRVTSDRTGLDDAGGTQ